MNIQESQWGLLDNVVQLQILRVAATLVSSKQNVAFRLEQKTNWEEVSVISYNISNLNACQLIIMATAFL
jgi:hypothetical protein